MTPPAGETVTPAAPAEQPAPAPAPEAAPAVQDSPDLFEGTPINPDVLVAEHPELKPLVDQFKAAFTQKTQQVAEQRKQIEALGSVEELEQAVELMTRIADPSNWPEIQANLTRAMQEQGLAPATAPATPTPPQAPVVPGLDEITDPELAPFAEALKAQQAELAQLRAERQNEVAQAQAAAERAQRVGQIQQMENAITQANPTYKEADMDFVYKLGAFHDANLLAAQQDYEAIRAHAIQEYIAQKAGTPHSVGPAPVHAPAATTDDGSPKSLQQIGDELAEHMRQMQAAGELEL